MKTFLSTLLRPASVAACGLAMLAGCAVGPDYARPALALPKQATEQSLDLAVAPDGGVTQHLVAGQDIPGQWWQLFHSAALNDLIEASLKNNPDLQAAQAAMRSAQENLAAQQGAYFPTVGVQYTGTRQKIDSLLASPTSSSAYLYNFHTAQLDISYAPDVFGLNRRTVESLQAQADLQQYQLQAAYLTLTSTLVNAVLTEAALRAQLEALQSVAHSQQQILTIGRQQLQLGQLGELDITQLEVAAANAEAALAPVNKQLALQRDQIKALSGKFPDDAGVPSFALTDLQLPGEIPLTLPSSLLDHRPDILAAEAQLRVASANVGVATANRLPSITLGVNSYGSSAYSLADLFKAGTSFWTLAGGITQPLFDGGMLKHRQASAQATFEQTQAQYRATVISAFQNVADALAAIESDALALAAAKRAERSASKARDIARRQLALGDISPLLMLGVEQTAVQAKLVCVQAEAARYSDTVGLFQALGGGWWNRSTAIDDGKHSL